MVSIKFNILIYAIIFMLPHFVTCSLQDTEKSMVVMTRDKIVEEGSLLSPQQKDTSNVSRVDVEVGKITGGRKMMKEVYEERIKGKETASKMASSSSIKTRNGDDHKEPKSTKNIHQKHHNHDSEVKLSSTFMSLNADYNVPRSHPPRNN